MIKNLYISTTFLKNGQSVYKAIKLLNKNNIFNIEIGSNHKFEKNLSYFNKFIRNNNFLLHNYFPVPKKGLVINIASYNTEIRQKSIKQIYKSIDFAKKYNCKIYTFHPGFIGDPKESLDNKKRNYDFIWDNNFKNNYNKSWLNFVQSLRKILNYAKKKKIKICLETEGSIDKKNLLLLQKPVEFDRLFKIFKKEDLFINLNFGHLNLASKAFRFSREKFIYKYSKHICAFELSHNYRKKDDHLPLKKRGWYWKIIRDKKFSKIFKILEYRNCDIKKIKRNYLMCANNFNNQKISI